MVEHDLEGRRALLGRQTLQRAVEVQGREPVHRRPADHVRARAAPARHRARLDAVVEDPVEQVVGVCARGGLLDALQDAVMSGLSTSCMVIGTLCLVGALGALVWLPGRVRPVSEPEDVRSEAAEPVAAVA